MREEVIIHPSREQRTVLSIGILGSRFPFRPSGRGTDSPREQS